MDKSQMLVIMLNFLVFALCLVFAFLNWTLKKQKTYANGYYNIFLLNFSLISLFFLFDELEVKQIKFAIPVLTAATMLMPPLMWIYLKKMIVRKAKRNFRHLVFPLAYFVVSAVLLLMVVTSKDMSQKVFYLEWFSNLTIWGITWFFIGMNVLYIVLAILLLIRHRRNINNNYSYTENLDLNWIQVVIYSYVCMVAAMITSHFIPDSFSNHFFYGTMVIYVFFTGFQSLRQKEIIIWEGNNSGLLTKSGTELLDDMGEMYDQVAEQQFTESQHQLLKELGEKLVAYVEQEKPYLDQELTIFKLAKELKTNTRYLSYVINKEHNQSFINYINQLRIEEVKKSLLSGGNQNLTIEALAQNAGFKSKSSFNAAFKRHTGTTPSGFVKEHA